MNDLSYRYRYGQEYLIHANNAQKLLDSQFSNLSNLSSLCCTGFREEEETSEPHVWTFLAAYLKSIPSRGLHDLRISLQNPTDWIERLPILQNVFKASKLIRILKLEFYPSSTVPKEFSHTAEVLSQLDSLCVLDIAHQWDPFEFLIDFNLSSFFIPGKYWQHLNSLSLEGATADYQHLFSVLTTHASSLKSLQLVSIRLTSLHRDSNKPLSWIELFVFLNENMFLSRFICAGCLETVDGGLEHVVGQLEEIGHGESWDATDCRFVGEPCGHKNCLKGAIQRYVTHQGLFPFKARHAEDKPILTGRRLLPWTWPEDECFRWSEGCYREAFNIDIDE